MDLVKQLEAEYLPKLRFLESELRERHPDVQFAIGSSSTGSLTSFQGHSIYIECTLPDAAADASDNVALSIEVCHLDRVPRIMADVCWGHPSGTLEDSLDQSNDWTTSDQWPEASDETLQRLGLTFPRLAEAFAQAVSRRRPPS